MTKISKAAMDAAEALCTPHPQFVTKESMAEAYGKILPRVATKLQEHSDAAKEARDCIRASDPLGEAELEVLNTMILPDGPKTLGEVVLQAFAKFSGKSLAPEDWDTELRLELLDAGYEITFRKGDE